MSCSLRRDWDQAHPQLAWKAIEEHTELQHRVQANMNE
jgi:hypothetical protein